VDIPHNPAIADIVHNTVNSNNLLIGNYIPCFVGQNNLEPQPGL